MRSLAAEMDEKQGRKAAVRYEKEQLTAKEAERSIVDIETLKQTNESLISTLDEVLRIQTEGREKRREAEIELRRIEGDLKNRLLQVQG